MAGLINVIQYHVFSLNQILEYGCPKRPDAGLHSVLAQLPFCFGDGLTLARAGGGVDETPHEFFWNGFRAAGRIALKFCTTYKASFAQLLGKKLTGSGQVTEL